MLHEIANTSLRNHLLAAQLADKFNLIGQQQTPAEGIVFVLNPFDHEQYDDQTRGEADLIIEATIAFTKNVRLEGGSNVYYDDMAQARYNFAKASGDAMTGPQQIKSPTNV